jgi:hypothetical protein
MREAERLLNQIPFPVRSSAGVKGEAAQSHLLVATSFRSGNSIAKKDDVGRKFMRSSPGRRAR